MRQTFSQSGFKVGPDLEKAKALFCNIKTHAFQLAKSNHVLTLLVQSCLQVSKGKVESGHGLQLTLQALSQI